MKQKRLMLLGGLSYLIPAIEEAHKLGIYVITADYLPNNVAHKYSDEYCNVSIIDKEKVLQEAKRLQIDGILSFAVDPGVVSAAYVAGNMGLPFHCSYKSACILQDKSLFREFLNRHGFNCPKAKGYDNILEAQKDIDFFTWPVIVKPTDSAGSKGVSRVDNPNDLCSAIEFALSESHNGRFIIEDFLEKDGFSVGSESFVVDGKLLYNGFYDQYFDNEATNPYTPSAEVWPTTMSFEHQEIVKKDLQRLFSLLEVKTGLFNIECRLCKNGKVYLMEVSPRAGGNRLAEMLNHAADVNIIEAEIKKAVGLPVQDIHEPNYKGHFAISVLHSKEEGIFDDIIINPDFKEKHIIEEEIRINKGDKIYPFNGANMALGTLFLKFETRKELEAALSKQSEWLTIKVIKGCTSHKEYSIENKPFTLTGGGISYEEIEKILLGTNFHSPISLDSYINKILDNADFIIYKNTGIYGLCAIYANNLESGFAYITYIAIDLQHRGNGNGRKLLEEACRHAKDKGFKEVRLEVKKENSIALKLYTHNGFKAFNENETSFFMHKML